MGGKGEGRRGRGKIGGGGERKGTSVRFFRLVDRIQRCGVPRFSCSKRLVSRIYPYRIRFPQPSYLWFCPVGLAKRCGGVEAALSDAQSDARITS